MHFRVSGKLPSWRAPDNHHDRFSLYVLRWLLPWRCFALGFSGALWGCSSVTLLHFCISSIFFMPKNKCIFSECGEQTEGNSKEKLCTGKISLCCIFPCSYSPVLVISEF